MKYSILIVNAFIAFALAQKQQQQQQQQLPADNKYRNIPIVSQDSNIDHDGTFSYSFEGGDGTRAQQNGQLKYSQFDPSSAGEAIQGGYSYTGDDGKVYTVTYTADENGYRPTGDHLPTPPPVPEAIARAVEYLKSLPPHKDQ